MASAVAAVPTHASILREFARVWRDQVESYREMAETEHGPEPVRKPLLASVRQFEAAADAAEQGEGGLYVH